VTEIRNVAQREEQAALGRGWENKEQCVHRSLSSTWSSLVNNVHNGNNNTEQERPMGRRKDTHSGNNNSGNNTPQGITHLRDNLP